MTPPSYPSVIAVKISFPPLVLTGAVFCSDFLNHMGMIRHLGEETRCRDDDEEPCTCYLNGREMDEQLVRLIAADYVACYKGRSFTIAEIQISSVEGISNQSEEDMEMNMEGSEESEAGGCTPAATG